MGNAEPERIVIRRALPFAPTALVLAFALGAVLRGEAVAWSAALGVAIVALNLVAYGLSIAWAARISPIAIYAVALGGFALRLIAFTVLMVLLTSTSWFSPVAFTAAFMPGTIALLAFEMKVMSERKLQSDLWYFRDRA